MNLILLTEDDFIVGADDTSPHRVRLNGRRLQHVRSVHRATVGDTLRVGLLGGKVGRGVVTSLTNATVELEVALDHLPPAPLPVTLLLALPRPKSLKRIIQATAAMGVKRVVLLATWRVEKSFWNSPALRPEVLREQMLLGLEQSGDTIVPEISIRTRFKPFVEDEVPALIRETRALAAHPLASQACPRDVRRPVTLAVGPEGGFTPYEVEQLQAHGFEAVSLGERRLRVEHVVPALLGRLF